MPQVLPKYGMEHVPKQEYIHLNCATQSRLLPQRPPPMCRGSDAAPSQHEPIYERQTPRKRHPYAVVALNCHLHRARFCSQMSVMVVQVMKAHVLAIVLLAAMCSVESGSGIGKAIASRQSIDTLLLRQTTFSV